MVQEAVTRLFELSGKTIEMANGTRNGVSISPDHNLPPKQGDWRAKFLRRV
jgi:hypothetical protein